MSRNIILLFVFLGINISLATHPLFAMQDSADNGSSRQSNQVLIDTYTNKVDSLESEFETYLLEKQMWKHSIDKSHILFTVINAFILVIVGLGYFAIFRDYVKNIENEIEKKFETLESKHAINESLIYRTMYFNCIATSQYDAAILWASRVILKEVENLKINNFKMNRLKQFVANMQNLTDDHVVSDEILDNDEIIQITDNLEKSLIICKDFLDQEVYETIRSISKKMDKLKSEKKNIKTTPIQQLKKMCSYLFRYSNTRN